MCKGMVGVLRNRLFPKVKARFVIPVLKCKITGSLHIKDSEIKRTSQARH